MRRRPRPKGEIRRAEAALAAALLLVLAAPRGASPQPPSRLSVQVRAFGGGAAAPAPDHEEALTARLSRAFEWDEGAQALTVGVFSRLDLGGRSSTVDLPELHWEWSGEAWELRAGLQEVAWGVVESSPVTDAINQLDVGGHPTPRKLGQPMLRVRTFRDLGTLEASLLPWFRERRFEGRSGALWAGLPVAEGRPVYESGRERRHLGWALRWSHTIGDWSLGVAHFSGTDRQPRFLPGTDGDGDPVLVPRYDLVDRSSAELLWVRGPLLWKLEAIRKASDFDTYVAWVAGAEIAVADYLSLFLEYLHDARGGAATTSLEDDVFVGVRLLTFDWTGGARAFVDRRHGNALISAAVSRRLGGGLVLTVEGRHFEGEAAREPAHALRLDGHLSLGLEYFF